MKQAIDIYAGRNPCELPTYSYAQAGRILRMPAGTLRAWAAGTTYQGGTFEPLITRPDPEDTRLSFINLVEAHVLRALRTRHGVPMLAVREALDYAEQQLQVDRLLVRKELRTTGGRIFLEKYGELIELSRSGQMVIVDFLRSSLKRVDYDVGGFPVGFFPWLASHQDRKTVIVDPRVSFGRPSVASKGIRTAVIADRIDSGETIEQIADDYGLQRSEVKDAVYFERAA